MRSAASMKVSVKKASRTALAVVGITAVTMAGTMFGIPTTADAAITYATQGTGTLKEKVGWLDFAKVATGPIVGADKLIKEGDSYTFTDKDGLPAGWSVKVTVSGVKVGTYTYKAGELTNVLATPLANQAPYGTGNVTAALGTLAAPKDNVWVAPFDKPENRPVAFKDDAAFPVAKNTGTTLTVNLEATLNGKPTPVDLLATNAQVAGGTVALAAESRTAEQVKEDKEKNASVWTLAENLNAVPEGKDPKDAAAKPAPKLINGGTKAFGSAAIDTYDGTFLAKVNAPKTVTVTLKGKDGSLAESVGFGFALDKPAAAATPAKQPPTADDVAAALTKISQDLQKGADELQKAFGSAGAPAPAAGATTSTAATDATVAPGVSNLVATADVPGEETTSTEPSTSASATTTTSATAVTTVPETDGEPTPVESERAQVAAAADTNTATPTDTSDPATATSSEPAATDEPSPSAEPAPVVEPLDNYGDKALAIEEDSTGTADISVDGSYPTVNVPVANAAANGDVVTVTLNGPTFFGEMPTDVGVSLRKNTASTSRKTLDLNTGTVTAALAPDGAVTVTYLPSKDFYGTNYVRISAKTATGTVSGNIRLVGDSVDLGPSDPGDGEPQDTGKIIGGVVGTLGSLAVLGMLGNQIANGGLGTGKTTPTGRTGANPNGTRSTTTSTASVPSGFFTDKPPVGQTTNTAQGRTTTTVPRATTAPRTTSYTTRTTVPRTTTTTRTTAGRTTTTSRTTTSTSRLPNTGVDASFLWAATLGLLFLLVGASFIATRRYFAGQA